MIKREEIGRAAACTHKGERSGDIIWDTLKKNEMVQGLTILKVENTRPWTKAMRRNYYNIR
jgi:hypothetical protein